MIKAGALYFAIVIAFVLAIISASLLTLAMHSRNNDLKEARHKRLVNNLNSGVILALIKPEEFKTPRKLNLYHNDLDSITISCKKWGIFDLILMQSFILQDTLKKAILIGTETDSIVIYLSDEDRPLSLSDSTKITGHAFLPKSGIRKAYTEGESYAFKEVVFKGQILNSSRKLPPLNSDIIAQIIHQLSEENHPWPELTQKELHRSFNDSTSRYRLSSKAVLKELTLKGNIILFSDSAVTISASSYLDGIQIFAPYIKVEKGFRGNCQLFASDSISIDSNVHLKYPSVAGVIQTKTSGNFPKITLRKNVNFEGILFSHEEKKSTFQTMISIDSGSVIKGELYSSGTIKFQKKVQVNGKISSNRLLMQTSSLLYENFLINVTLNRLARSPYYLSSPLFPSQHQNRILRWLD